MLATQAATGTSHNGYATFEINRHLTLQKNSLNIPIRPVTPQQNPPMQISSATIHTAPRDAATVIILRDSPSGLEVFLVKRHGLSDVLGGAYVFPGGKLDDSDLLLAQSAHLDQDAQSLHSALAEPQLPVPVAAGLYVAALREAFEECGVLFAQDAARSHSLQLAAHLETGMAFNQVLALLQLRLQTRALQPWSRWITPKMPSISSKRFDTRFFVAALPPGQAASHDNFETTDSVWLTPRAALEQYWRGDIQLAPPQIMTLAQLARHADVAQALAFARQAAPALIEPEPFDEDGERVICYPGDARHSVSTLAMQGPTRLRFRNQRFEPEGGFSALFE
jgi:8-oxo-dGTP pyrophosphatase MutT (NUDIX family)